MSQLTIEFYSNCLCRNVQFKMIIIMMTIFTMTFAAVMFSGMVLCMGMFLKHVVNSIPEMTNMSHSVSLSK